MFGSEGFEAAAVLQGDIAAAVVRTSECDVGGLFAFQLYFADQLALRIYNGYRSFVVRIPSMPKPSKVWKSRLFLSVPSGLIS